MNIDESKVSYQSNNINCSSNFNKNSLENNDTFIDKKRRKSEDFTNNFEKYDSKNLKEPFSGGLKKIEYINLVNPAEDYTLTKFEVKPNNTANNISNKIKTNKISNNTSNNFSTNNITNNTSNNISYNISNNISNNNYNNNSNNTSVAKKQSRITNKKVVRKSAVDLTEINRLDNNYDKNNISNSLNLNESDSKEENNFDASEYIPFRIGKNPSPIMLDFFNSLTPVKINLKTTLLFHINEICKLQWANNIDNAPIPYWKYVPKCCVFDRRIQDFIMRTCDIKIECPCNGRCWSSKECPCSLFNLEMNKDFSYCYNLPDDKTTSVKSKFKNRETNKTLINTFQPRHHIFECSSTCKCDKTTCHQTLTNYMQYEDYQTDFLNNFIIQRVRKSRLVNNQLICRVMWGLYTTKDISKNSYVMTYCGEIISNKEAEKRGKIYDSEAISYLFDICSDVDAKFMNTYKAFCKKAEIDYLNIDRTLSLDSKEDFPLVIDATEYGNLGRFINHSCNPNLKSVSIHQDCNDPRFAMIGLFATKDIKAGTELTIDYHYESFEGAEEVYCLCLEKNCRNFLYTSN